MNELDEIFTKKEVQEKPVERQVDLIINEDGNYDISSKDLLYRAAHACIQQGFAPPSLAKGGPAAVSAALLMCKQFELPFKAIGQMAFINGVLTVHSTLYAALAQRHPDWRQPEIFFTDDKSKRISVENANLNAKVYACVIRVPKENHKEFNEYYFTLDDAKQAGLYNDKSVGQKPWDKYTKDMLYHKAKARAYSREYASALEGVYMTEDLKGFADIKDAKSLDELEEPEIKELN